MSNPNNAPNVSQFVSSETAHITEELHLQKELKALDDQSKNLKNAMNVYKQGFMLNNKPVLMYNDTDEDEDDRQMLL